MNQKRSGRAFPLRTGGAPGVSQLRVFSVALMFIMIFANPLLAQSFRCILKEVKSLSVGGEFDAHPLESLLLDQEIIVDRQTGKVFHNQFGNESYTQRQVMDYGSKHSSFKVVAYSSLGVRQGDDETPFRNMTVLQVHTHVEGLEKPFVVLTSGSLGYGVCK